MDKLFVVSEDYWVKFISDEPENVYNNNEYNTPQTPDATRGCMYKLTICFQPKLFFFFFFFFFFFLSYPFTCAYTCMQPHRKILICLNLIHFTDVLVRSILCDTIRKKKKKKKKKKKNQGPVVQSVVSLTS